LNETGGPNHVGNYCSAPIIVDTQSDTILYQSSYYYIGHFSRFLKRGDQIVKSNLDSKELLAISSINKNNELTSVVMNKSDQNIDFTYSIDEIKLKLKIPSRSIITIIKKA
jgi:glucosylceramidase